MKTHTTVEIPDFPGFYEIPQFSRYGVSRSGEVINKISGKIIAGSKNPSGYHNFRLTDDFGYCYTYGRHRLLCDVFKAESKFHQKCVVNHLNGVKGDDRLDNLEWTTQQENTHHAGAMGMSPKCLPVAVRCADTKIVEFFPSVIACAEKLGMSKDAVAWRLRFKGRRLFPERKQYRSGLEERPWFDFDDIDTALNENGTCRPILTRNVLSGQIKSYSKMVDLANELGVSPATVTVWLKNKKQPVLPGFIQLKWVNDKTPWRIVVDPVAEMAKFSNKKPVKTICSLTGNVNIYPSAIDCAKANNLKPTALNHRLKSNGKKIFSDNKSYMYY